jgi:hypothetical protein
MSFQTSDPSTNSSQTNTFILFFRGDDWDKGMPPDELQVALDRVMKWFSNLRDRGIAAGGQPLAREGRNVAGPGGRHVTDGPFAESKEAVAGYLMVRAGSMEEAVAIARSCPTLDFGITVEVRPVLDECPVFKRIEARLLAAAA